MVIATTFAPAIAVVTIGSLPYFQPSYDTKSSSTASTYSGKLLSSVNYLKSHFNNSVGLVFESEYGIRPVSAKIYSLSQTFWVYSDNLLATLALQPYDPALTSTINRTIQSYRLPPSEFFEVLFGHPIP